MPRWRNSGEHTRRTTGYKSNQGIVGEDGGASDGESLGSLALPTSGAGVDAAGTSEGLGDTGDRCVTVVVVVVAG
jgi:hypothetical protein